MESEERQWSCEELDEALLAFRVARKTGCRPEGWLRAIRRATGVPVNKVAERMEVCRTGVFRLEESEMDGRIGLETLRRAAEALDCELVYALAPRTGTLGDMAAREERAREGAREEARRKKERERQPWLEAIGWRELMHDALRKILRREGYRVRPVKRAPNVEKEEEELKAMLRLAALRVTPEELELVRAKAAGMRRM